MVPTLRLDGARRQLGCGVITALAYFALSKVGLAFKEPTTQVAVVWVAGGFALTTMLLVSRRVWPVVVVGVFVGNLVAQLTTRGVGWLSVGLAVVNALSPLVIAALIDRADEQDREAAAVRPSRTLTRLLGAIVIGNTVTSLAGASMISVAFDAPIESTFLTWYFGDALGFLMVAPVAIAYRQIVDRRPPPLETTAAIVGTSALAVLVFLPEWFGGSAVIPLPLLVVPVLLWSALRMGLRVTSVLLVIVGGIGAWAAAHGHLSVSPGITDVSARIGAYQLFLATVIVCTMFVSAIAAESAANERSASDGRERVESILRALTEYAVIGTDVRTGEITFFNVGAERMLGHRASDVVGRLTTFDLHVADEIDVAMSELGVATPGEALTQSAVDGCPETRRWTYRRSDESHVRVMLTVSAERDLDGRLVGFIGVARELTEQERHEQEIRDGLVREREIVEKLRVANETRGEFISTVSHELRTPLTNVIGFAEMLGTGDFGDLTPPQLSAVTTVEDNGRRLLELVEDLLTLNGMDTGRVTTSASDVDIAGTLRASVDQVSLLAERADVSLRVELDAEPVVRGDARQLERMLVNIVGNAVKFTPEGGTVAVSLALDGVARITVTDTGIGIPTDELDQVFDRFFRSREAFQQAVPGTGLGLPIARSIVEAHDGTIRVESEVGVGTTVTIELPARLSPSRRPLSVLIA